MKSLTSRQQQVFELIHTAITRTGLPPTRAELCAHFSFRSPTAAEDHLKALARKGWIELLPGRSRGIRLVESTIHAGLPLVGRVAAGEPILAEQNIEDHFDIDPQRFQPGADYLLRVRGESMRDAGILDNDLLAVHRTHEARNGQVVVARLGDEVTVKRFRRRGVRVRLEPENPDFDPIHVDLRNDEFVLEGLGVGVVRDRAL